MKVLFTFLLLLSGILFFTACDKDEPIENEYRIVVTCDTNDEYFDVHMQGSKVRTKNRFEYSERSRDVSFDGYVACTNPEAVITIQTYLNGRVYKTEYGKYKVYFHIDSPLKNKKTNKFVKKRPF